MESLDPTIVNLAKAIKRAETGDRKDAYTAVGDNGTSYGAYQYQDSTWKDWAKEFLGDSAAEKSVENQNKVAYNRIKSWKDQGLTPAQIASKWNSGKENKYKDGTGVGYNAKIGVSYNVPEYVTKVSNFYRELSDKPNLNTPLVPETPQEAVKPKESLGQKIMNTATDITDFLGLKGMTDQFGADIARARATTEEEKAAVEFPEMKDVLGSAAVASSYLIPGAGVGANLATKVGAGIGAGYLADVGMGLQEDKENPFTPGFGTIVGATIPVFGTLLGKATRTIPKWLIRGQLKKLPTEVSKKYKPNAAGGFTRQQQTDMADEVLKMKSWTKKGLVAESQGVAKNMETEIDTILNSPKYKSATGNSKGVFSYVKEKFGNSEFVDSDKKIIKIIKNIAKDESTLVDKVYNGTATIAEQNTLRKAIDRGINYPSVDADSAFNKRIGKEFVNYIRGNVQTTATETVPLFDEYSKSLQILKAAKNVRNSGDISIFDIMAFIHGGIGGVALERAARLPNARIGAAKVINKLRSSKIVPLVSGVATKEAASQNSDQKSEQ